MDTETIRNLLAIIGDDGKLTVINMNQVRMVDQFEAEHVRIWFSETYSVNVNGAGGGQLASLILRSSRFSDGSQVPAEAIPKAAQYTADQIRDLATHKKDDAPPEPK